jgi:hypothetical protein
MDRNQARLSAGCVSKWMSHSTSVTQGWTLRVQKCAVGRSLEVWSRVPARPATKVPDMRGKITWGSRNSRPGRFGPHEQKPLFQFSRLGPWFSPSRTQS